MATFGAGCYWGTEKFFVSNFQKEFGACLQGYAVGFMSPFADDMRNPTYRDVCTKKTFYVEVFHVRFDATKATYEDLVRHFFTFHDPTVEKKPQYSSTIFYHSEE